MAGWSNEGDECWKCGGNNTALQGFTKGPKEMHFWCHDCGLIAHHDGETDTYTDNKPVFLQVCVGTNGEGQCQGLVIDNTCVDGEKTLFKYFGDTLEDCYAAVMDYLQTNEKLILSRA